jgi:putative phosphoribosyl transferase
MKIRDRFAAGNILGDMIKEEVNRMGLIKDGNHRNPQLIVLGIPRGGIITALAVAKKLSAILDVVVCRRLLAPQNEEIAIGAIMESGEVYLNNEIIAELKISQDYIEKEKTRQLEEMKCQNLRFRQNTSISLEDSIQGNIVVLIDDGAASGATLTAALRYIKGHKPLCVIVGIPIAPRETVSMIKNESHKVVSIFAPTNHEFVSVEQYYLNFNPVTDFQVIEVLQSR